MNSSLRFFHHFTPQSIMQSSYAPPFKANPPLNKAPKGYNPPYILIKALTPSIYHRLLEKGFLQAYGSLLARGNGHFCETFKFALPCEDTNANASRTIYLFRYNGERVRFTPEIFELRQTLLAFCEAK